MGNFAPFLTSTYRSFCDIVCPNLHLIVFLRVGVVFVVGAFILLVRLHYVRVDGVRLGGHVLEDHLQSVSNLRVDHGSQDAQMLSLLLALDGQQEVLVRVLPEDGLLVHTAHAPPITASLP